MRQKRREPVGIAVLVLGCLAALWMQGPDKVQASGSRDAGETKEAGIIAGYNAYQERFEQIKTIEDISAQGYHVIEKHVFDIPLIRYLPVPEKTEEEAEEELQEAKLTEVVRPKDPYRTDEEDALALQEVPTVRFFSAIEDSTHRAALFLADKDGKIVYKCNQLECNYVVLGELEQPITDIVSVAFSDLNKDERMDIVLIAGCVNDRGEYAGKPYKVGEVLFQTTEGQFLNANGVAGDESAPASLSFCRDWRINDKINRFGMNKSAKCIISFVRDNRSTEFLYTATTDAELLENGFKVIKEQSYRYHYEKLGNLKILPGVYSMADYDIFMIYLVNEQGDIVWSFQPMGDYDNLYSLRGMSSKDLDGDGMKDMLVVARYSREGENGEMIVEWQYSIYYQRTGGFDTDTGFIETYTYNGEDKVEELVQKIRAYWGWEEVILYK